ncbi:MAG TPA: hypothetical protein QGF02_02625 [Candidatus Babeliales bacterium]|nr:hypothetical protein [Candidatus Babeliales bacterium]
MKHSSSLHMLVGFLLLVNSGLVFWFEFLMKGQSIPWFPTDIFTIVMSLIGAFMIFRTGRC